MKALTIWQPWATLIAFDAKPYEFRGWKAPKSLIGQRIAIHAGARPVKHKEVASILEALEESGDMNPGMIKEHAKVLLQSVLEGKYHLPHSCIVCTAVLGEPVSARNLVENSSPVSNDSDREEHFNFAWPLTDIQPIIPPTPARGKQGFWNTNLEAA